MRLLASAVVILMVSACAASGGKENERPVGGGEIKRFASDKAFQAYLKSIRPAAESLASYDVAEPAAAPAIVAAEATAPANPSITNNQTIGVDEGGIVKQIGRFLVVLQDGRLFSVDLGEGPGAEMRLAGRADVYRSRDKAAEWYDEMLVKGDRILVTAYSYAERASEITVLRLAPDGAIRREGRFLLSSNDYYSTENYATRLVGDSLVFYAPIALEQRDGGFAWPRLRRAQGDGEPDKGEALIGPTDVYAPAEKLDSPVLHTVSICPLKDRLECRTTAFVGPWMREFYVTPTDAFLWMGGSGPWGIDYGNQARGCPAGQSWRQSEAATIYRIPLDGSAIGAVKAEGTPADQFAFESHDGRFRALLGKPEKGCGADGAAPLALLDIPLSDFGTRMRTVPGGSYAGLPAIEGGQLENRFIGDWLVYGGRADWSSFAPESAKPETSSLFAVPLADPKSAKRITLPHNAVRIERAGNDAVVTGYRDAQGMSLSYIRLGGAPALAATTLLPGRFESESRSHAFNALVRADGSGLIGLPTSQRSWRAGRGWSDSERSDLSFIAIGANKQLMPAGELVGTPARSGGVPGYSCEVSCVDWYGNSRPIFTGGRTFALMGTELVEGQMRDGRIVPAGRVDLTRPIK